MTTEAYEKYLSTIDTNCQVAIHLTNKAGCMKEMIPAVELYEKAARMIEAVNEKKKEKKKYLIAYLFIITI